MAFFRSKLVLKMSLFSICVILFSCLFYFSYSFVAPDGLYQYMEDDTVFQYISFTDAQRIVDHVVKQIPEKVLYSNGPTFDIPLTQFDISGRMQVKYATVRGLDRLKIKDFSYNVETRVLQTTANYEHITLSMVIKNSLEWNAKKAVAPTAVRFDLYKCSLKVRGHFNGAKIWDTFAEITIGSAKVYIKEIFGNTNLTREISDYLEENLHRIISANRNLVSNAVSEWAETGINNLLQKNDRKH